MSVSMPRPAGGCTGAVCAAGFCVRATATVHHYTPHDSELPLTLQDHSHPVRYRNVWMRRLAGYDLPEK